MVSEGHVEANKRTARMTESYIGEVSLKDGPYKLEELYPLTG